MAVFIWISLAPMGQLLSGSVEYEPIKDSDEFKLVTEEGMGLFPSIGFKITF